MLSGDVRTKVDVFTYRVQVIDRVVGLLEAVASQKSGLTLVEISERLRVHRSTVYRLLMVLERHGLVGKGPLNSRYHLGLKFFELASKVVAQQDVRECARPHLERLVFETGETAHLCILDHDEVLYLEKVEAQRTVRIPSIVGRRYPAHCGATGKSLLAFLPEKEVDDLIKRKQLKAYTRNTITTPAQLKAELQLIRDRGYSFDNEEFEEGLKCIGAPVRDYSGRVIASIGIAGPTFRMTEAKVLVLADSVIEAANALSGKLGHHEGESKESTEAMSQVKAGV